MADPRRSSGGAPDGGTIAGDPLPRLLRDRAVLGWAVAQGVSEIGDGIWFVALAYTAARLGSPGLAGLVLAAAAVPRALLMLVGGAVTDRIGARRLMLVSDCARMLVLLGALVVYVTTGTSAALLVGVGLLFGVADAFYNPAAAAFPRALRPVEDMTQLAGIRQMTGRIAVLGGPPLGGLTVALAGLGGAMGVDAASFAVIALVLLAVRPRWPHPRPGGRSLLGDVRDGISYIRGTPRVRDLAIALSGLNVFVSPVVAVGLALRTVQEHWGPVALGVLTSGIGGGAVVGTLAVLRRQPGRPVLFALLLLLAQAVALGVTGSLPFVGVLVAMLTVGLTAGLASPLLVGAFQATVGEKYVGRAASILNFADEGLAPLALAGFGALAGVAGLSTACLAFGAGFVLLLCFALSRPHMRVPRPDGTRRGAAAPSDRDLATPGATGRSGVPSSTGQPPTETGP